MWLGRDFTLPCCFDKLFSDPSSWLVGRVEVVSISSLVSPHPNSPELHSFLLYLHSSESGLWSLCPVLHGPVQT